MIMLDNFNPKETQYLFELKENFNFFKVLLLKNKLPKVVMLTGEKGIGKSTLINHIMHYYFDTENYDIDKNSLNPKSSFHKQYLENLFQNIVYLNQNKVKIDDVRNLKDLILKTPYSNKKRFIIFDDIDTYNTNSLNALLKTIEEPTSNNQFILINNKTNPLLETIRSRALDIKINLNMETKNQILSLLIEYFKQEIILNPNFVNISPGNFLKYNFFFSQNKIEINNSFLKNLNLLINFQKKNKDFFFKNLMFFFVDYYYQKIKSENRISNDLLIKKRSLIIKNINDYFVFNLSHNTLLNSLKNSF